MHRYVDKDEVLEKLSWDTEAYQVVNMMATADVVEVTRCRDCKHHETCRTTNVWAVNPGENWFCADGERKDDA